MRFVPEMSRVLVGVVNPVDKEPFFGGPIARHSDSGNQMQVLIVAEGSTSLPLVRSRPH